MIAQNGWKIKEYRQNGYKPGEMIIVSLVGKLQELNHVIYADYKKDYDWKYLKSCDVCIFASSGVDYKKTLNAIASVKTRFLALWDVDRLEGADFYLMPSMRSINKPKTMWEWVLHHNVWIPMQNEMFQGLR